MKRKALPSSTFFADTKLLIVEDNGTSQQDIASMRARKFVEKIRENAGLAEVLKAAEVTGGRTLTAQVRKRLDWVVSVLPPFPYGALYNIHLILPFLPPSPTQTAT